jgi:hypothetical protein
MRLRNFEAALHALNSTGNSRITVRLDTRIRPCRFRRIVGAHRCPTTSSCARSSLDKARSLTGVVPRFEYSEGPIHGVDSLQNLLEHVQLVMANALLLRRAHRYFFDALNGEGLPSIAE